MKRAGGLALSLAILVGLPVRAQEGGSSAHEREWRTRRWALELDAAAPELRDALASPSWTLRSAALDAVARGIKVGAELPPSLAEPVRASLFDDHADVRVGALRVMRAVGGETQLMPDLARRGAGDRLPAVRRATARALETVPCSAAPTILALLCVDADERVARAARRSLFALPSSAAARSAKLAELTRLVRAEDDGGLLEAARWLDASEPEPLLLAGAIELFEPANDARTRGWRSVFTAISIGRSGIGSVEHLIDGWSEDPDPTWVDPGRRVLLRSAARSGREDVALNWLLHLNSDPNWEIALAILDCISPARALELGQRPTIGRRRLLTERAWKVLAPEIGTSIATWALAPREAEVVGWLAPEAEYTLRRAAVDAFARTLARNGDPAAAALLASALKDSTEWLRKDAFLALASADDIAPHVEVLATAWRGWDAGERARAAEHLPRGVPLPAFRPDLIELGSRGGDARRVATELLAGLAGDAGVFALLSDWLEEELALFLDATSSRTPARELELFVQGELRALAAVDAEASVELLEAALVRTSGRSEEIGKVAAAGLGRSRSGRERLERFLGTDVDLRTRIEAEIQLASAGAVTAVAPLLRDYPDASWDLAVRMLRALASCDDARSVAFFLQVASDEGDDVVLRLAAVEALGRRNAVSELTEVLDAARDLEVLFVALRSLGAVGSPSATESLLTFLDGLERSDRLPVEVALLRGEVLGALGKVGDPPARAEAEWLRVPLDAAAGDLDERFHDRRPGAPSFRFSGELELAAGLAAHDRVARVLAVTNGWWRLDGELLLALGERVAREPEASRKLLAGAALALEGLEGPGLERKRARSRFVLAGTIWRLADWVAYAQVAGALLRDLRAGALPRVAVREALGAADLGGGIDPLARLSASVWQARAWSALEAGDPDLARQLAREADRRVGRSDLARTEQERLAAAIATR